MSEKHQTAYWNNYAYIFTIRRHLGLHDPRKTK